MLCPDRETWEKVNLVFHDNGTLTYNQQKVYRFDPDQSVGSEDDVVVVPNIPMLVSIRTDADWVLGDALANRRWPRTRSTTVTAVGGLETERQTFFETTFRDSVENGRRLTSRSVVFSRDPFGERNE